MSSAFCSGKQYFFQSNVRSRIMLEAAIEVGQDIAANDAERSWVQKLQHWHDHEMWPGHDVELEVMFPSVEEQRFWSQAFHSVAQRVYHRKWGNQEDQTWQVQFITACQFVSLMLTGLVWKVDRNWYPQPLDGEGMRPDPLRIQM